MDFESLVHKLSPVLRRITCTLARQAPYAGTSDDFYQESLVYLWDRFTSRELAGKTDSYLLQGCYFHVKNHIRLQRKHLRCISIEQPVYNEQDEPVWREYESPQHDCRDQLHARLLVDTICNNGFTPREKQVILLWKEALDTREIGRRLGISHVRVVKLMAGIRQKCRVYRDYS